jgi:YVTN family beta-propeller protein
MTKETSFLSKKDPRAVGQRIRLILCASLMIAAVCAAQMNRPAAALLVLNKADSELTIVDPGTLKVVARVPTGRIPHEVAASEDGKTAVVTNYGQDRNGTTLSVVDLEAQKEIHRVDLGELRGPHGIVFHDGKAYFTVEGSNSIARYDPETNQVDWTLTTSQDGTHMLVVTGDGKTIFTANIESNTVTSLVRELHRDVWRTVQIAVGKGPEGIDLSPDGKEVWAANSGDGTVSIIDVASKKVTQTIDVHTKRSNRLKFTPDGRLVLISDLGTGELVIVDTATRKEVKRLKLGTSVEGILIEPDGTQAFVAVSGDNKVAAMDLKTLEVTTTFTTGNGPDGLAWANK